MVLNGMSQVPQFLARNLTVRLEQEVTSIALLHSPAPFADPLASPSTPSSTPNGKSVVTGEGEGCEEKGCEIETVAGERYRADYVVCTLPLGVLQKHPPRITPPLPGWKLSAMNQVGETNLLFSFKLGEFRKSFFFFFGGHATSRATCEGY